MNYTYTYEAIIIGGSWGGLAAVTAMLEGLPAHYPIPVILVLHRGRNFASELDTVLGKKLKVAVKEIEEKESILPGYVYIAPANYHVLIEEDHTFSLDNSSPVLYSRPSIDVAFESAAHIFKNRLVGIILTGANNDGAKGLQLIVNKGGTALIQDPSEAEANLMPKAAIVSTPAAQILTLQYIQAFLLKLATLPHPDKP